LYVVAARREVVNQRMDFFDHARLPLESLDIRETGQRNISAAIKDQKAAVCLIYAEPNGVQLTVTYQGELYLERYIRESLFQTNEDEAPAREEQKLDRVALEVQRSIDFVHRNAASIPFDGIYVAPTQSDIGLLEKLQTRLLTDVSRLDMDTLFEWPAGSELEKPEVQALYFNALGAALRAKE
jgi:MSHA biogenesis protein MshI